MAKFTLEHAQECAQYYLDLDIACGGCQWGAHCGIGQRDMANLGQLLSEIDPHGLNVAVIELKPLGDDQ